MEDFRGLPRRALQFLCKKNRIPANMTNIAMADALQALQTVQGMDEIPHAQQQQQQLLKPPYKPGMTLRGRRNSSVIPKGSEMKENEVPNALPISSNWKSKRSRSLLPREPKGSVKEETENKPEMPKEELVIPKNDEEAARFKTYYRRRRHQPYGIVNPEVEEKVANSIDFIEESSGLSDQTVEEIKGDDDKGSLIEDSEAKDCTENDESPNKRRRKLDGDLKGKGSEISMIREETLSTALSSLKNSHLDPDKVSQKLMEFGYDDLPIEIKDRKRSRQMSPDGLDSVIFVESPAMIPIAIRDLVGNQRISPSRAAAIGGPIANPNPPQSISTDSASTSPPTSDGDDSPAKIPSNIPTELQYAIGKHWNSSSDQTLTMSNNAGADAIANPIPNPPHPFSTDFPANNSIEIRVHIEYQKTELQTPIGNHQRPSSDQTQPISDDAVEDPIASMNPPQSPANNSIEKRDPIERRKTELQVPIENRQNPSSDQTLPISDDAVEDPIASINPPQSIPIDSLADNSIAIRDPIKHLDSSPPISGGTNSPAKIPIELGDPIEDQTRKIDGSDHAFEFHKANSGVSKEAKKAICDGIYRGEEKGSADVDEEREEAKRGGATEVEVKAKKHSAKEREVNESLSLRKLRLLYNKKKKKKKKKVMVTEREGGKVQSDMERRRLKGLSLRKLKSMYKEKLTKDKN